MNIPEENITPCWVCGKVWKRQDSKYYAYFNGILVCLEHSGAEDWYRSCFKLAEEKLKNIDFKE